MNSNKRIIKDKIKVKKMLTIKVVCDKLDRLSLESSDHRKLLKKEVDKEKSL